MSDARLLEKADAFVRARLSDKRYTHTIRVADTAEYLAKKHGLDPKKTRLAALLHDAARELSKEEFLEVAGKWGVPVGDFERRHPKLLHGPVAAELAWRELSVEDGEVLEAIRTHTAGEPGMGPLALAIYVADKIEPARDYPSVERLRNLADKDLYEATAEAIRRGVAYNKERGKQIHPVSLETLEWLEKAAKRRV